MMNAALFGTSADPPTIGHKAILRWLVRHYDYVAVWAADNPFKAHQTSLTHRSAMLQLLIDEICRENAESLSQNPMEKSAWLSYDRISLRPELSSPRTLFTVQNAQREWPEARFTLVIGTDLVPQLPKWYQIEDLLQRVQLLIVPRSGYALKELELETLKQMGAVVTIADLAAPETSSTAYRERGDLGALTTPIEAYIHQQHLYKCAWQDIAPKAVPEVTAANR